MYPEYQFIQHHEYRLPYQVFGNGENLLFAFHGFGKTSDDFKEYAKTIGATYTIIAFDFFYHGPHSIDLNTPLPPISNSNLAGILEKLMWDNKKVNCSLLGYSLGGRLVLGLIHKIPNRIQNVFLIAPDGLRTGLMQRFVSGSEIGKKVGFQVVKNPTFSKSIAKLATQVGILSKKKGLFVISNLESKDFRLRAIRTWLILKQFSIHQKLVIKYLNNRPINIDLIFGKYDKIIPSNLGLNLKSKLKKNSSFHEIEAGHSLLYKVDEISKIINSRPL